MREFNNQAIQELRERVTAEMSAKRARHTLAVEQMAARLAELYCPEKAQLLRVAALLHDVTKEYSYERQIELCKQYGVELEADAYFAPKTLHARTAAAIIPAARACKTGIADALHEE